MRDAARPLSAGTGGTRPWPSAGRGRRVRWWAATLAVAGLHLLLLGLLQRALLNPPPRAERATAALVLVRPLTAPAPPQTPPPSVTPPRPASPRAAPRRAVAAASAPAVADEPAAPPPMADSAAASTPVAAAASAPRGSLLDTEASRRAIREAARQRSAGELGALASGEPAAPSAEERLGRDIARGAHGDCLKGEFPGAGMGLLSLPFWLIAEMRDKCRR